MAPRNSDLSEGGGKVLGGLWIRHGCAIVGTLTRPASGAPQEDPAGCHYLHAPHILHPMILQQVCVCVCVSRARQVRHPQPLHTRCQ